MFLRFVKILIRTNRNIEDAKTSLFNHKCFSLEDSFALFDINKNGLLTASELTNVFADHSIELGDTNRLVEIIDED